MSDEKVLIKIENCRIQNQQKVLLSQLSWQMNKNQAWLVIGPNGGGKADFLKMLAGSTLLGQVQIAVNSADSSGTDGSYFNLFENSTEIVSLEQAASLIENERKNDESEYIEGGVDHGKTGRLFLCEAMLGKTLKKNETLPEIASTLDNNEFVKLCGVNKILNRGLKYMSTGEIRRTLLCHSLLSGKKLLILSDPFAGLDVESRKILLDFFNTIVEKQTCTDSQTEDTAESALASMITPYIILAMERYSEIPQSITHVLEFKEKSVSFCGSKNEYEEYLKKQNSANAEHFLAQKQAFCNEVSQLNEQAFELSADESRVKSVDSAEKDVSSEEETEKVPLVQMKNVTVGWDGHTVLKNLSWTLNKGEHWLIRGPNGSGKTTFLELITGDNMQVYCNDVSLFGRRRGSGETIWEIKEKLGIVSYRMHVEYRMLGSIDLESVIISGFHDSIGLYEQKSDVEIVAARKWLKLGNFEGREKDSFSSLSYGEQRALLILRAAVKCPSILILDEPCHGLDESYREKILTLLETIADSGTTTLLHVTHDPTEVLPCEKHILELHPGEEPMYRIIEEI